MSKPSREIGFPITAKTRFRPKRRPSKWLRPAASRHARHLGEVMLAWNMAHGALFRLFQKVAADGDYMLANGLWHSIQSDSTQRRMLEAAVTANLPKPLSIRNGILWAITALNELAKYRNDAAHADMAIYQSEMLPGTANRLATVQRLLQNPFEKHWRQLRGDLYAIAAYLDVIELTLQGGFPRPLSKRPPLHLVSSRSASSQERRRRAKRAARERQRQASPAARQSLSGS